MIHYRGHMLHALAIKRQHQPLTIINEIPVTTGIASGIVPQALLQHIEILAKLIYHLHGYE